MAADDNEWLKAGSEFIGKRVELTISCDDGSEYTETGRVVGWLPADVSDFLSDQGEYVALWRVKFDDRTVTSQDLEELEVVEAIAKYSSSDNELKKAFERLSLVWVRIKGYPVWPAMIVTIPDVPELEMNVSVLHPPAIQFSH